MELMTIQRARTCKQTHKKTKTDKACKVHNNIGDTIGLSCLQSSFIIIQRHSHALTTQTTYCIFTEGEMNMKALLKHYVQRAISS